MGQNYFFGCISFNSKVIWPNLVRSEILDLGTLDLETAVSGQSGQSDPRGQSGPRGQSDPGGQSGPCGQSGPHGQRGKSLQLFEKVDNFFKELSTFSKKCDQFAELFSTIKYHAYQKNITEKLFLKW